MSTKKETTPEFDRFEQVVTEVVSTPKSEVDKKRDARKTEREAKPKKT